MKYVIKITFVQIWKYLTLNTSYPYYKIESTFWSWKVDANGNVKYNQLKTLFNYLAN